ncbi:hypothetical protein MKX01_028266 [Papaver californicum]|nr:hypothetical protein MKX01_028266 [Papaver californicum]
MEDSTLTTIEFLRARLLSERSASKTAKQKADELAKRVVELEEQLISVSLETKKTEMKTEEVLTILESNGICDFMEALDSSSDEEQILVESGQDTISSSKESSTLPIGRSLSWKSNDGNSSSAEKRCKIQARRREGRFLSTSGSSSKPRLGKSCRQIKCMDLRTPADDVDAECLRLYSPVNGLDNGSGNISGHYENSSKKSETGLNEKVEDSSECLGSDLVEYPSEDTSASVNVNESRSDAGMENEIGDQTKLIGWYEAEEIAQREWEEKFREVGSCTPDSCEHGGNQSDITEERNEAGGKDESLDIITSNGKEAKSAAEEAYFSRNQENLKTVSNGFIPATPCLASGYPEILRSNSMPFNKSLTSLPDYSFNDKIVDLGSMAKGDQKYEEWPSYTSSCGSSSGRQVQRCISYYEDNISREGTLRSVHKRQQKNEEWSSFTPLCGSSSGRQVQRSASYTQGDTYRGRSLRSAQKHQQKNEEMSPYTSPCGSSSGHQVQKSSYHEGGDSYGGVTSGGGQNHNQPIQQCGTSTNLGSVLDELQRAKLSLKHELTRLPSSALAICPPPLVGYTGSSSFPALTAENPMETTPLGCASLFRVPTDMQSLANNRILRVGSPGLAQPLGKLGNCLGPHIVGGRAYI